MATRPMQYGGGHRQRLNLEGGGAKNNTADRFNDMASYVTDTSSITMGIELGGISFSDENDDDDDPNDDAVSFIDSATSALSGLTGWTSAYGGGGGGHREAGMDTISEMGESEAFQPMAHSKSYKSSASEYNSQSGRDNIEEEASAAMQSGKISALSFDMMDDGSVETSLGEIEVLHAPSYKSRGSRKGKVNYGGGGGDTRPPLMPRSQGNNNTNSKAVQFRSEGKKAPSSPTASVNSNGSKKREPVPPMRDPNMDDTEEDQMWEEDCNYDINPTTMFLILESHDWKEAIALLDGKNGVAGQNKGDEAWNLGSLFGAKKLEDDKKAELTKKQQDSLKQQARTWIVRRERNGILRWRMLPLHAALAFNAPFDVVLRLYHLYPGAVRCRNDQGMVPLHHCFKFGNEDKVLELLLDVFPEALTVVDDKGHTPIACTPKDGGDNERRSNIMTLFCNFQVEMAKKQMGVDIDDNSVATEPDVKETAAAAAAKKIVVPVLPTARPSSGAGEGTLGATAPRYTSNNDYNAVTYNSIKPLTAKSQKKKITKVPQAPANGTPLSPKDEEISDRYAMTDDGENNPVVGNAGTGRLGGLSTISEDEDPEEDDSLAKKALKSELLMLREIKKKKGIRKMFARKKAYV